MRAVLRASCVAIATAHAAAAGAPAEPPRVSMRADHMVLDAALAGPHLLAGTQSGRVERFAWREGRALGALLALPPPGEGLLPPTIRCVAVSPSGKRVAVAASDSRLRLVELDGAGAARTVREVPSGDAVACRFVGEDRVVSGSLAGEVALVSFADGSPLLRRHLEYAPVQAIAVEPRGRHVAVAFAASAIHVLGSDDLDRRAALVGHRDTVFALAWPEDSALYSGSQDKRLLAWDLALPEPAFRELSRADGYVTAVAAHPGSGRIAFAMGDGRIGSILAKPAKGAVERVLEGHSAPVQVLLFADRGRHLISAGNDARVLVWDLEGRGPGGTP